MRTSYNAEISSYIFVFFLILKKQEKWLLFWLRDARQSDSQKIHIFEINLVKISHRICHFILANALVTWARSHSHFHIRDDICIAVYSLVVRSVVLIIIFLNYSFIRHKFKYCIDSCFYFSYGCVSTSLWYVQIRYISHLHWSTRT